MRVVVHLHSTLFSRSLFGCEGGAALRASMASGEGEEHAKKRMAMQSWEMYPAYVPAKVWNSFREANNMMGALDVLLNFLLNLGMRTPSEPTQSMLVAALILREDRERRQQILESSDSLRSILCSSGSDLCICLCMTRLLVRRNL